MAFVQDSHRLLTAAATVNATLVTGAACDVVQVIGYVARTSAVYLKLYDIAEAPDENDTPKMTITLPGEAAFAITIGDGDGVHFKNGVGYRMTTAVADNSTAALTSGDVTGFNLLHT